MAKMPQEVEDLIRKHQGQIPEAEVLTLAHRMGRAVNWIQRQIRAAGGTVSPGKPPPASTPAPVSAQRTLPLEPWQEPLRWIYSGGKTAAQAARHFMLPERTIKEWAAQHGEDVQTALEEEGVEVVLPSRRRRLDAKAESQIRSMVRMGTPPAHAFRAAGCGASTWARVKARAKELSEIEDCDGIDLSPGDLQALRLFVAIEQAESLYMVNNLKRINGDDPEDKGATWKKIAWILERRFPEEFGQSRKLEHSGPAGAPLALTQQPIVISSVVPTEDLSASIDALRARMVRPTED